MPTAPSLFYRSPISRTKKFATLFATAAHQGVIDGVPDDADGGDDTGVGNADAHDIG